MKRTSNKISYNKCRSVWDWIIQISLWTSIVLLIVSLLSKQSVRSENSVFTPLMTGMLCFVFIIYVVNNTAFSKQKHRYKSNNYPQGNSKSHCFGDN